MTPKALLQVLLGLLVLAAIGAGGYAVWSYQSMSQRVVELEATAGEVDQLKRDFAALNREAIRRSQLDAAIRDARTDIARGLQEAAHEDPASARYLGEPIPQRVRDVYLPPAEG